MIRLNNYKILFLLSLLLGVLLISCKPGSKNEIDLSGAWRFKMDTSDIGINQKWFSERLPDTVVLPGSMKENDKGFEPALDTKWTGSIYDSSWYFAPRLAKYREPGNLKFPFWLTPNKRYVGAAWYQKEVEIPAVWRDKRIVLFFERVHTESTVWVDDRKVGMQNSLVAPHEYDLSAYLASGPHVITIRIDNRIKEINVGPDSHSLTDHTQGNWNGIIGKMELRAHDKVWIDDMQIYPNVSDKSAKIRIQIGNLTNQEVSGTIVFKAESFSTDKIHKPEELTMPFSFSGNETQVEVDFPMGDEVQLWDEFDPALYRLTATLNTNDGLTGNRSVQFGMREFTINGTRFEVNGRPVFLRGDVDCAAFPLTGYPPTDVGSWERIFKIRKAHGLNHVRFHSWCPPEAAFTAADKVGVYLQPEGPSWANHGASIGDGLPVDQYIYDETNRMAKYYGNYASFCMMAYGNEPAGRNQAEYLDKFVKYWVERDNRRVYTGASVGRSWPWYRESQYIVKSYPRGVPVDSQPNTVFDHREKLEGHNKPYVSHEVGQYCVFPNFKEIDKYTGVYKAKNFELFREDMKDHGMLDQAEDFLMASGKLQTLFYKAEIEAALRTPGFAGFQLLQLNDFPGQGTALVGVLDVFFEEKGYISPREFRRFCNQTVPLARIPRFVYRNNENFQAEIEVSHFGKQPIENATIKWKIMKADSSVFAKGSFKKEEIPLSNAIAIGSINQSLSEIKNASKLILEVSIKGTEFINTWDFWVYPDELEIPDAGEIIFTDKLDEDIQGKLENGAKVFLNAAGKVERGKEVAMHFKPVFWNTSWFKMRPPHTLGHLVNPDHPAFSDFPTEYHSNYQWWEIVHKQQVMILDDFPKGFKPIVQPIDTWFLNRKLGLIFEAKAGEGKILVCSADLTSDWENRPAARQLYYSLVRYMHSEKFNPEYQVDYEVIRDIFEDEEREQFKTYSKASTDELMPKIKE